MGGGQARVVATDAEAGSVVAAREPGPCVASQRVVPAGKDDEARHRKDLRVLRVAHRIDHRGEVLETGVDGIAAEDLPQAPRGARQGGFAIERHGALEPAVLRLAGRAVTPGNGVADVRMVRIEAAIREAAEYVPLEQDLRPAIGDESTAARFDADDRPQVRGRGAHPVERLLHSVIVDPALPSP